MKYWQLTSILRDEEHILRELLSNDSWGDFYNYFISKNEIIYNQNRGVLDRIAPDELVAKSLDKSKKYFYLDSNNREIYSYQNESTIYKISILSLYKIIGGDDLEELLEKTQIDIVGDEIMQKLMETVCAA